MRIFLTLHPSANLSVPGSMTWYHNLYEPLLDLGHEVVLLRMDEVAKRHNIIFRGKKFKEVFSNELLSIFQKEQLTNPFDFFLSYITELDVYPDTIQLLRNAAIPMANFSCNNTHQFNLVENISPHFDFNLHSEKDADSKFKAIGANPVWFPMAANPKYYYPSKSKLEYDVSFVGAAYAKRAYYVNFLINHQIGVDCFGPNWLINLPYAKLKKVKKEMERIYNLTRLLFTFNPDIRFKISSAINNYDLLNSLRHRNPGHFHYPLSDREMISVYNKSKINLGFLEVFTQISEFSETTKQHLHLREFEVPMCGGLFLTNYMQELEEFYELEKEIITFRSEYELADKIRFYLNNEKAAAGIRKAAYLRAMNLHTYQRRFKDLFKKLSL